MWSREILILLASSAALLHAQTICPPLTPTLPISTPLRNSAAISEAAANLTSTIESLLGELLSVNTSFSVDFYSTIDSQPLFTYHHSSPELRNATEGVQRVDSNSIYRIASISKAFTVYTYLQNVGDLSWNQPITRYIPELSAEVNSTADGNDVDMVRWSDITVGALASQLPGIARDAALGPMYDQQLHLLGMPSVPSVNGSFCGESQLIQFPCDRESYFLNLLPRHPVVAPFQAPVYSNMAFQLLAYALENMTGTPFEQLINSAIADLDLNSTYYGLAPTSSGVITPEVPMYSANLTILNPGGGIYSTLNDMRRFGISILNATHLPAALTRRWLKPHSFTPDTYLAVGAPWEIVPYPPGERFPTQIYTKSGNIGLYTSLMGLISDYGVGFTILSAGTTSALDTGYLADLLTSTFLPAVKEAAREQTERLYGGTYTDEATNSSLQLSMRDNNGPVGPVMAIDNWTFNGTDMVQLLSTLLGLPQEAQPLEVTMFPTGLKDVADNGDELVSWRGTLSVLASASNNDTTTTFQPPVSGPFSTVCTAWAGLDPYTYGYTAFDEILFRVSPENGTVLAAEMRVLQQGFLEKTGSGVSGGAGSKMKKRDDAVRRVPMVKRW